MPQVAVELAGDTAAHSPLEMDYSVEPLGFETRNSGELGSHSQPGFERHKTAWTMAHHIMLPGFGGHSFEPDPSKRCFG
jgi:hypothetical protein